MEQMLQIIYISRSTFISTESASKIEPNIARILAKSRINNRRNGLVGVLYFGDGNFFQCIEGNQSAINQLMDKLAVDPRHKDLKVVSRKTVNALSFADWAMKFAPIDEKITYFLQTNGFQKFDPYAFSDEVISRFLNELFYADDPTPLLSETSFLNNALETTQLQAAVKRTANIALLCAVLALMISVLALVTTKNLI